MFSKILLGIGLVLLALKFGFRARLRELGRRLDRFVNIVLVIIVVTYLVQIMIMVFSKD